MTTDFPADRPLVSFVSGFYNRASMVERTVASMAGQTYPNVEIIIFDDCSTDGTADELDRMASQYEGLKVIHHPENIGFAAGIKQAVAASKGSLIAVQGSGDVSDPKRIEKQVSLLLSRPQVGLVGSFYANLLEETGSFRIRSKSANGYSKADLLRANPYTHGEVMFRRETYDVAGGYRTEFKFSQDYDLWLRMIDHAELATVEELLYTRFVQFSGVTYTPSKSVLQGSYSLAAKILASASEDEKAKLWEAMQSDGPLAIAPASHPALQRRVLNNTLRLLAWGNTSGAKEMATHLDRPLYRWVANALCGLADIPVLSPARIALLRVFGLNQ